MVSVASQPPARQTSGSTTDPAWGPLADDGYSNPFFYHAFQDDFDNAVAASGLYTVSKTTTGTVVHTAGDGGLALFSTAAASNDAVSIQLPAASFTLTLGKKLFYLTRLQLADATACSFVAGIVNTTATPLTGGSITDGIWFSKAAASTQLVINTASASVVSSVNVAGATLANATNIDMAFYLTRLGDVLVFFGSQLVGFIPQSGSGTLTPPQAGPSQRISAPTLTAANLNVTMGIAAGAVAIKTLTADFHLAHKER